MPRIRTGFSFRAAVGKIENVMSRLKECEYPAASISDRASCFGWVRWAKLAKENGLKPVFGIELAVTENLKEEITNTYHGKKQPLVDYWTFYPKDDISELNKLITLATSQFYYQPLLTYKQAQENKLFKIVGSKSKLDLIHKDTKDIFISLSPSSASGYIYKAREKHFQFVRCSDNKFPRIEDQGLYETICGMKSNLQSYDQHIQTYDEWNKSVRWKLNESNIFKKQLVLDHAEENFKYILNNSTAKLLIGSLIEPKRPKPLLALCQDGAKKLGVNLNDKIYKERLNRELKLIKEKKFEDYFYIISDLCSWARNRMLVGPARGSSCGSLVCFLLGITTVDPIPFGLIFERFIDINRNDLPDIDIDFVDEKRDLVFQYLEEKYGQNHLAKLGNIDTYKVASALKEAGTALQIPKAKCDAVVESALKRSSGDARALDSLRDTLNLMASGKELLRDHPEILVACEMEGHPRHYSRHASAAILTKEPVEKYIAIDKRTGSTLCDKKDAEVLNLLKVDLLGLSQLSVFEEIFRLVGIKDLNFLNTIPLDDEKAFQILNDYKFAGIFQFDGMALQSVCKQFHVTELNDIVATTALARPGPLASGSANEWVKRRNGKQVEYPHLIFEPYVKDTLGIILYQEQVMEIGRNIGDLSWEDVTALRKAMSKSLGKEYFDQFGDRWKKGAIAKGADPELMRKFWDDMCAYGSWSFNKSHAVAYGLISYYCCWFKAHYPIEFAAATLSYEGKDEIKLKLLREFHAEGIDYVPIDPDISTDKWTIGKRKGKKILIGPITNIKGVGEKTAQKILEYRRKKQKLPEKLAKMLVPEKAIVKTLWPITEAFERSMPDPSQMDIVTKPTPIGKIESSGHEQVVVVFCIFTKINPRDENESVLVAKRKGKIVTGLTASLNLFLTDDSGTIFGKIDRFKFPTLGKPIVDRGKPGKLLYAVKGRVPANSTFRMIRIDNVKFIGFMS